MVKCVVTWYCVVVGGDGCVRLEVFDGFTLEVYFFV